MAPLCPQTGQHQTCARIGDPALARNVCCVTLRGRRRFLSWVHIRLIGNAAAVAAGGDEAKAAETERNR
jgi:hypothetical protein